MAPMHKAARHKRLTRAEKGFTLIEVLVAFTIAALALAALFQAFSTGMRSIEAAAARGALLAEAENRLAEVGATIPLAPGLYQGQAGGRVWAVEISPHVSATDDGAAPYGPVLLEVEVAVEGPAGRSQRLRSLRVAAGAE